MYSYLIFLHLYEEEFNLLEFIIILL